MNGGLLQQQPQQAGGLLQQQPQQNYMNSPLPPIVPQLEPIRQQIKVVLPRPVYRQAPRSSTKVQPRSWTRAETAVTPRQAMPGTPGGSVRAAQQESNRQPIANTVRPVSSTIKPPAPFPSSIKPPAPDFGAAVDKPLGRSELSPSADPAARSSIEETQPASPTKQLQSPGRHQERPQLSVPDYLLEFKQSEDSDLRVSEELIDSGNQRTVVFDPRVSNEHGCIQFHGKVDLSKVSIGKVVRLQYQEIEMYPDQDVPKVGEGLNTQATVQLYKMNPTYTSKKNGEIKSGPAAVDKYKKMLEKTCKNLPGAEFVSYEEADASERGWIWTFKMENFNRQAS